MTKEQEKKAYLQWKKEVAKHKYRGIEEDALRMIFGYCSETKKKEFYLKYNGTYPYLELLRKAQSKLTYCSSALEVPRPSELALVRIKNDVDSFLKELRVFLEEI